VIAPSLSVGGGRHCRPPYRLLAAVLCLGTLCAAFSPAPAFAHGAPIELAVWGAWGRRLARCQRIIARNAAVCALRAWEARRACRLTALSGGECDEDATDQVIEAARLEAVDHVGKSCTDQQVQQLMFLNRGEAQLDVVSFCRELEDAVDSAVFLPAQSTAPVSPVGLRCVDAASLATTKLLRQAFDSRLNTLDRIAQQSFSPPRKTALVAESTATIASDASTLAQMLSTSCSDDEFVSTYGRDAVSLLGLIAGRADCLSGQAYAQGGIICPNPQCGNGMREFRPIPEDCDDGNVVSGDGCSATCRLE
jgi:cysteine-rich repeat protein